MDNYQDRLNKINKDASDKRVIHTAYLALFILSIEIIVFLVMIPSVVRSPVQYEVKPEKTLLCVGEPLIYDSHMVIMNDTLVRFYATIVDMETNRTVYEVSTGLTASIQREGAVTNTLGRIIELDIPPGSYEYRLAAENSTRNTAFIFISFEVIACVPQE